jgi:hypothetical protein
MFEVKCQILDSCFCFFGLYLSARGTYLRLGKHKTCSYFESFGSWQILVLSKLFFQLKQLLTCESCTRPPCLSEESMLRAATCNKNANVNSKFYNSFSPEFRVRAFNCTLQTQNDIGATCCGHPEFSISSSP